jgi:hypothetical protein
MYIIEVFDRKKWRVIKNSLSHTKPDDEVEELNKLVSKEQLRELLVKEKYRVKKIKASEGAKIQKEMDEKRRLKEELGQESQAKSN